MNDAENNGDETKEIVVIKRKKDEEYSLEFKQRNKYTCNEHRNLT